MAIEHRKPNTVINLEDYPADNWVVIQNYENEIDASIDLGMLQTNGIPAILTNQTFSSVLPIGINTIGSVNMWVPRDMIDEARRMLKH